MVMVDTMQNNVNDIHKQIHKLATIGFDEKFDQMKDFGFAPGQNVLADVDVEGLSVCGQIIVAGNLKESKS